MPKVTCVQPLQCHRYAFCVLSLFDSLAAPPCHPQSSMNDAPSPDQDCGSTLQAVCYTVYFQMVRTRWREALGRIRASTPCKDNLSSSEEVGFALLDRTIQTLLNRDLSTTNHVDSKSRCIRSIDKVAKGQCSIVSLSSKLVLAHILSRWVKRLTGIAGDK